MAKISNVQLPDGNSYDIRATAIPYGEVDSTSTSTVYTATVPGITELTDGVCVLLRNGVVTSASGFTININGLGAKPSYSNMATGNDITPTNPTRDTTIFNINYTMLFIYSSTIVDGGCWIGYRGYDANTNTIGYQLRTNSQSMPMKSITYRYRLLFTSADGQGFVPANNSTSTNATASRTVCQDKINPWGAIYYYGTTASVAAGSRPSAAYLWQQYNITLGYSFNRTGAALALTSWRPVYVKCAPQTDGSVIIDSTTPYTQALPTTDDGFVYIFLGIATAATTMELVVDHPIYYFKNGAIRIWTNAAASGGGSVTSVGIQNGGGLTVSNSPVTTSGTITVGHSNSVTAQNTQGVYPVTIDANGHIASYGNAVTIPSAGTTASAVSTTASGGSASTYSKSDHVHSISSSTVTSALGYTPYNSTNPNGYTSNTGTITGVSVNNTSIATSGVANVQLKTINGNDIVGTGNITVSSSDTNVTNTLSNTTKYYVTGTSSSTTNTGTQYFDSGIYATTTAGQLNATTYKVNERVTLQWNSTDSSLDFIFS